MFSSLYFYFQSLAESGRKRKERKRKERKKEKEKEKRKKERKKGIYWMSVVLIFSLRHTKEKKRNRRGWVGKKTERKSKWGIGKWGGGKIFATDVILIPWYPRKKSSPLNVFTWMPKSTLCKRKCFNIGVNNCSNNCAISFLTSRKNETKICDKKIRLTQNQN